MTDNIEAALALNKKSHDILQAQGIDVPHDFGLRLLTELRADPEAARAVASELDPNAAGRLLRWATTFEDVTRDMDALRADNERLREAAQAVVDAQPTDWGHQEDEVSVEVELREPVFDRLMDAIDALRAPLAPAAPTPGEEPSICGAQHPEHPGTHCRRRPVHSGEHATARYDVTWDNAYLSAPGEGPSICGAHHPEHPGTHCRRKQGHSGEHATARHDVQWDNAYLSAPGEEPSDG